MDVSNRQRKPLSRKSKALFALAVLASFLLLLEIIFRALGLFAPKAPFTVYKDGSGKVLVR